METGSNPEASSPLLTVSTREDEKQKGCGEKPDLSWSPATTNELVEEEADWDTVEGGWAANLTEHSMGL